MKTMIRFFVIALFIPFFFGCDNDDNESNVSYKVGIATVENTNNLSSFFFRLDNDRLMWVEESNYSNYKPKDGQRIIAYYTVLSDKRATGLYDSDVRLLDVYSVLTKGIFKITPATQDSIGNDSITIKNIWIGSDYLNVQFVYPGYNKIHYINLVSDDSKVYTDGKIHLEFRHNSNGDIGYYYKEGIASFNINELQTSATTTSVDIVVHVNVPRQSADKEYQLTYDFAETPVIYRAPTIAIPNTQVGVK